MRIEPARSARRSAARVRVKRQGFVGLPYWIDPLFVVTVIIGVSLFLFTLLSDKIYLSEFRQPRQPVEDVLSIYGLVWVSVVLGFLIGRALIPATPTWSRQEEIARAKTTESSLRLMGYLAVLFTLVGYAIYIASSKADLGMFMAALAGEVRANFILKDSFDKIPGLTSFMNLACWWFVYVAFRRVVQGERLTLTEIGITIGLLGLTIVRGFAVNERRVIFELLIPAAISCVFWRRHWSPAMGRILRIGPIVAPLTLMGVFVATEYFRSWTNFWQFGMTELPYVEWALVRLAGYYVTALNNGAAALSDPTLHTYGTLTFSGIAKFPFVGDMFWPEYMRVAAIDDYKAIVSRLANEEFNNPGGASVVLIDFGYVMGSCVLFFTGLFVSLTFRFAQRGGLLSILLYSQIFFSMLEITRFWNFLSSFSVINLIFLGFIAVVIKLFAPAPVVGGPARRRSRAFAPPSTAAHRTMTATPAA